MAILKASCAAVLACLMVDRVDAVRLTTHSRKNAGRQTTKVIAGVPVYNYHLAFDRERAVSFLQAVKNETVEGREHWIVMLKEGSTDADLDAACAGSASCTAHGHSGGVPFLEVEGTEADLEKVLQDAVDKVAFVEPDIPTYVIPEEPADVDGDAAEDNRTASELQLDAEGAASNTNSWGLRRIGVPATPNPNADGRGVNIYVLDTGVRTTHTDFERRAIPTLEVLSTQTIECRGSLTCAVDRQGHGTHCAGTAAGRRYGVAPGATIHGVKVLGDGGQGSLAWSIAALDWIATRGLRPAVASMSLGSSGVSQSQRMAVDRAVNAGVTVVVAAGNDASDACRFQPAFVPSAITVGSTTRTDTMSSFSNWGSCVDIFAPGSDIPSLAHRTDTGTTTMSGTSMACPHVSGAAAILLQANPSMRPAQLVQTLNGRAFQNAIRGAINGSPNRLLNVR